MGLDDAYITLTLGLCIQMYLCFSKLRYVAFTLYAS